MPDTIIIVHVTIVQFVQGELLQGFWLLHMKAGISFALFVHRDPMMEISGHPLCETVSPRTCVGASPLRKWVALLSAGCQLQRCLDSEGFSQKASKPQTVLQHQRIQAALSWAALGIPALQNHDHLEQEVERTPWTDVRSFHAALYLFALTYKAAE